MLRQFLRFGDMDPSKNAFDPDSTRNRSVFGPLIHLGSALGPCWVRVGSVLGPCLVRVGSALGPFWVRFADAIANAIGSANANAIANASAN